MKITNADVAMMLICVNNQLELKGKNELYLIKAESRKTTLYQLKVRGTDRDISSMVDKDEMHEILASILHILQYLEF